MTAISTAVFAAPPLRGFTGLCVGFPHLPPIFYPQRQTAQNGDHGRFRARAARGRWKDCV